MRAKGKRAEREGVPACIECGSPRTSTREPYRYQLTKGWAVTVEDVEMLKCPKCGASVVIQGMEPLHRAIAAAVCRKPTRLSAEEVTFLRSHLEMTGRELAEALGVQPGSLSRWENGREPIGVVPDRLLRTLVLIRDSEAQPDDIETIAHVSGGGGPMRITARRIKGEWQAKAA